jgi:hypothetical protein
MDFYTNFYVPSLKKELKVNKITFGDHFKFNSYIENSDYINANAILNEICAKSFEYNYKLNNLDKLALLLHLKIVFINPILNLIAKNEEGDQVTYEIILKNVLKKIKEYDFNDFKLPVELYYSNVNDIIKETNQNINEIKTHIYHNKILMFDVPNFIKNIPNVYINCFDNTFFYFCKVLFSSNLLNFYKKIKILKKDFNFLLTEIYNMSPKEVDIFLNTK